MDDVTTLPRRDLTRADLDRMPDDGNRYELVEGEIVMTPAPSAWHQLISARLHHVLTQHAPEGLVVLAAPLDTVLGSSVVEPDLVVCRLDQLVEKGLESTPSLLVEISSPSSRRADWVVKKTLYERTGVPSYWIVDPDGPRLTAWKLVDGRYEQVADVGPTQTWDATEPFPMTIAPGTLLSR